MIDLAKKLYPIHRSITGRGVVKSLKIIKQKISKLEIKSFNSGTKVFDWIIPPEWNIQDAFIAKTNGEKIIDFKKNNLHIVNYSTPISKIINKRKLFKHLHTIPSKKNTIPYVTSYYKKYWGFCLSESEKKLLKDKKFFVKINSNFNNKGKLHYGELLIKGKSKKEILIHTYICHPKLANNEISGPTVTAFIANYFSKKKNNFSLRFVFLPETIGAIAYICKNYEYLKKNTIGGYVITCVGDDRNYSFLESKITDSLSNKIAKEIFKKNKIKFKNYSFLHRGSDERQYNSPGVNLPIASIMRTKYGVYPEYHTSDDNFKVVTKKGLTKSFDLIKKIIKKFDKEVIPISVFKCEPFLSKRQLYPSISTGKVAKFNTQLLDFLMYSDGTNRLSYIQKKIKIKKKEAQKIYKILKKNKLIY
jgi:aminopeptidase-like protein